MNEFDFNKNGGLIPAIVQDEKSGEILMLAYMNQEALQKTMETGIAHYWSRSRNRIWKKGETSGHVQNVSSMYLDCDGDTVLLKVNQIGGAACHEGYSSCFYRRITEKGLVVEGTLIKTPQELYGKK